MREEPLLTRGLPKETEWDREAIDEKIGSPTVREGFRVRLRLMHERATFMVYKFPTKA